MNAPRQQTLAFSIRRDTRGGVMRTSAAEIRAVMASVRPAWLAGDARAERIYLALWAELQVMNASEWELERGGRR